jgi:hypothetical protein
MQRRYLGLGLACLALVAGSVGYVAVGARLYTQYHLAYANYEIAPTAPCGALIAWSPPTTIYSAFYANSPFLTIRYRSPTPQMLRITLGIPRFTQDETLQLEATPAFQEAPFKPPLLDDATLDSFIGPDQTEGQLHLRVETAASTACDTSVPVRLMSRRWMHWFDGTAEDNAKFLAGWVTPHDPAIVTLIGRSAQWLRDHQGSYPGTTALDGYGEGLASSQDVRNQVNAVYDTLQSVYHIHYAQDNVVYSGDQRIQLPRDVLDGVAPTGMCLETTAILASAVEYLGMRPFFVIVPGHAFLGVALGVGPSAPVAYWETSDLNDGDNEYTGANAHGQILQTIDVAFERGQGIEPME